MNNVIQIKHGESTPGAGALAPYELGFSTSNKTLYIGGWEENDTNPQGIKVSSAGIADSANTAAKLKDSHIIRIKLDSDSEAGFNGTSNIELGVSGVLPIVKGGTGAIKPEDARANLGLGTVATESIVPITKGGTGAETAEEARMKLGLGTAATEDVVPISKGGTGATTVVNALANLGALSVQGGEISGQITSKSGGSWYQGRDLAIIRKTECTANRFFPVVSAKTLQGSWEIGTHNNNLYFSYVPDENRSPSNNNAGARLYFTPGGIFNGYSSGVSSTSVIAVQNGGTAATNATDAKANLQITPTFLGTRSNVTTGPISWTDDRRCKLYVLYIYHKGLASWDSTIIDRNDNETLYRHHHGDISWQFKFIVSGETITMTSFSPNSSETFALWGIV